MQDEQLITVNMVIADRSYRLKINAGDEEMVRKTIKVINDKIVEFKAIFAGKDLQDYISMVLLWYATEQQRPENNHLFTVEDEVELNHIDNLLNKALGQ